MTSKLLSFLFFTSLTLAQPTLIDQLNQPVVSEQSDASDEPNANLLDYIYTQKMFMAETKGLTHWLVLFDGRSVFAHNVIRHKTQLLHEDSTITHIGVDSIMGYFFFAKGNIVERYPFVVDLGIDRMTPSIVFGSEGTQVYVGAQPVTSLSVDGD